MLLIPDILNPKTCSADWCELAEASKYGIGPFSTVIKGLACSSFVGGADHLVNFLETPTKRGTGVVARKRSLVPLAVSKVRMNGSQHLFRKSIRTGNPQATAS